MKESRVVGRVGLERAGRLYVGFVGRLFAVIVKKATLGGNFNIVLVLFCFFWGVVLGAFGGNWGEKAIKRPYK